MNHLDIAAAVDASVDTAKRRADREADYLESVRDEACERAAALTTDPAALGEWIVDRMEVSAAFAEEMLDLISDRLMIEVEAERANARSAL